MIEVINKTIKEIQTPELTDRMIAVQEQWQYKTFADVHQEMPALQTIEFSGRAVKAAVLEPAGEVDETFSLVLAQEYMNGWSEDKYIRARIMGQIVVPNSRVIVLPENTIDEQVYELLPRELQKMTIDGDIRPLGELQMATLEQLSKQYRLGELGLTGYSKGARNVLGIVVAGSDNVTITHVNSDEAPSKLGRVGKQTGRDFMKSSGPLDMPRAISSSDIPALSEAMNYRRMIRGMAKFWLASRSHEGRVMKEVMAGSVNDLMLDVRSSLGEEAYVKQGFVADSLMFDPASQSAEARRAINQIVRYYGANTYGHASSNNVWTHAMMVADGILR